MSNGEDEYKTAIKEILAELGKTERDIKHYKKVGMYELRAFTAGKQLGFIEALEFLRIPRESISLALELGDQKPF